MRRFLLTALLTCVVLITHAGNAWGALSDYQLGYTTGAGTDMSGASTAISSGFGNDDVRSGIIDIGFTFNFNGTDYTQFSVSSNGILGLGTGGIQTNAYNNINGTTGSYPIITALWDDMIPSGNGVIYKLTGTPGNRVLTVQWENYQWVHFQSGSNHVDYTYQVRLYETSNIIDFWYGNMSSAYTTPGNGQIGMAASSSDFLSVKLNRPAADGDPSPTTSTSATTVNNLSDTRIAPNTIIRLGRCQMQVKIAGNTAQGGTTAMNKGDAILSSQQVQRGNSGTFNPFTVSLGATPCESRTVTYSITGPNAADYQIVPGSQSVAANGSGTPSIIFTPSATGTRTATLRVTDDMGFWRTYTLSAQGTTRIEWTGNIAQGGTSTVANGDTLMKNIEVNRLAAQNFTPVTIRNFNTNGAAAGAPVTVSIFDPSGQFTLVGPTSATLTAGQSFSPVVRFAPTGVGFQQGTLTITAEGVTRTFPLKAYSIAPGGSLLLNGTTEITSNTALFSNQFGCVGESSITRQVTIVNTGRGDYVISRFDVYQTDTVYQQGTPRYPLSRDRFGNLIRSNDYFISATPGVAPVSANQRLPIPFIVPQGESRTVYITFVGQENGKRFGRVFIGTNSPTVIGTDLNGVQTEGLIVVDLFGSGTGGRLADNANGGPIKTLSFAPTRVGDSVDMTYRFFNTGDCDLRISFEKLAITSGDVHDFRLISAFGRTIVQGVPMTGDAVLAPDASGTMVIRFKPQRNGSRRATLWMQTSDSSQVIHDVTERGAYYLDLYGFGKAFLDYSNLRLPAAVIDNGIASTGSTRVVNSSTAPVGIQSIAFFGGDAAQFSEYAAGGAWPATPFTMLPGEELTLGVSMLPTGDPGGRATTLRIITTTGETIDIAITGEAGSQGMAVSTNRMFVGAVVASGQERREVLMITNTGTLPIRLNAPTITGAGAADYRLGAFPRLILEPNAVEYLEVTFAPTNQGVSLADLTISSDAGTQVVTLEGEGSRNKPVDDPSAILPGRGGAGQPEITLNMGSTSSVREAAAAAAGVAFDVVRPNPARERAELVYHLSRGGDVRLELYDATGRLVRELASGTRGAGEHRVMVDVSELGAGVYHCRLATGGVEISRNVVVVK